MFREGNCVSVLEAAFLGVVLLACPYRALAQHGGGHGGGGVGGGSGLSGGGRPTGVSVKDDLKDFHLALAEQATSQQTIEYNSMLKTTAAASAELQAFQEHLSKENNTSELASRATTVVQLIEKARTENKNFLEGFSSPQKSGLKDITKKLTKVDSELAQQAQELNQAGENAKASTSQIVGPTENLGHALASFQNLQLSLGEEMGIVVSGNDQDITFNLPPVKQSVNFRDQAVAITTSGVVTKNAAEGTQDTFTFKLTEDMSDLQQSITQILRAQLDTSNRCGEQIAIQTATLTTSPPTSRVVAQFHFERWTCSTMFGNETIHEMAEGNPTIDVKLTPTVGEDGTLRLVPEIERIEASGLVGELLRTGSLGDLMRDKIANSLLSGMRQGADFKVMLPAAAQGYTTLHHARFEGGSLGKLTVVLDGDIRVSDDKTPALTSELKERSSWQEAASR
jgi:hypothetical protein